MCTDESFAQLLRWSAGRERELLDSVCSWGSNSTQIKRNHTNKQKQKRGRTLPLQDHDEQVEELRMQINMTSQVASSFFLLLLAGQLTSAQQQQQQQQTAVYFAPNQLPAQQQQPSEQSGSDDTLLNSDSEGSGWISQPPPTHHHQHHQHNQHQGKSESTLF